MAKITNTTPLDIIIVDDLNPESVAMVQSLYSRDPKSARDHIEEVRTRGAEKFMATFYVGYGHKSIGDCGTTTIFVEHGSILLPKIVQDWRLYNGQEASTRYLDMEGQDILNPAEGEENQKVGAEILADWMKLYRTIIDGLIPVLKEENPIQPEQKEVIYEKAIKARAFDIARGFLPAGVTTFASWHTNLRQAYDHLHEMQHHPLKEARDAANTILASLKEKYPSSFSHKEYPATEEYLAKAVAKTAYFDLDTVPEFTATHRLDIDGLVAMHSDLLSTRPMKTELPAKLEKFGQIQFQFALDFGSYRDIQRHRSGVNEMPILGTRHGFHEWYLERLTPELRSMAEAEIARLVAKINTLTCDQYTKQYYVPMGFKVACEFTCGLPAAIYVSELRASQTVHPTLRIIAQKMGEYLREIVPGIALHHDMSVDVWNIKRGQQDIVKKENAAA